MSLAKVIWIDSRFCSSSHGGQIQVPLNSRVLGDMLSAVLARLGLYSTDFGFSQTVVVPLSQLRTQAFVPRSLCAISEYEHPLRQAVGFRRVLSPRLFLHHEQPKTWDTIGLPFLEEQKIAFPNFRGAMLCVPCEWRGSERRRRSKSHDRSERK